MPNAVIEEPLYTQQINDLRIDWQRLDEAFISFESALLRTPEIFPRVTGTKLQRIRITGFNDVLPISIFFAVLGDSVHLVAAESIIGED